MSETFKTELELLVDRYGLTGVIDALADISSEKAEHIQSNYATGALDPDARLWQKAAHRLYKLQDHTKGL